MKHAFLAAALLAGASLAATPAAHAQGVRLGIKAGANYSNLAGDVANQDRYKSKFGPHGGLVFNIGLIDDGFLSLQPEVLFSQKGFKYADSEFTLLGDRYKYTGKVNYNYLDVPILFKINADGLFFELGPQVGYLLSVKDDVKFTKNGTVISGGQSYGNLDNVKRTEIGYAAGLGYQADSGPMIGLRYNGSFTDFANDGYQNNDFRNARNSAFQLYVGYLFGGK